MQGALAGDYSLVMALGDFIVVYICPRNLARK